MKKIDSDITLGYLKNMIEIAAGEGSPGDVISELIQYLGTKLSADRAYIFEENEEGAFDNTFEWCREGVSSEIDNLQGVPYHDTIEIWYKEFELHPYLIIQDMEDYKEISLNCYNYLKPQGISSIVAAPIQCGAKRAFFGVDNPSAHKIGHIAFLIQEIVCLFEMVMRMKENIDSITEMAMTDVMTGCWNRLALTQKCEEAYSGGDGMCVMMCDLNGLKKKNDTEGHRAGDKFVCDFAEILRGCFEQKNCYRIGGDEFLVVQSEVSEEEMREKTQTLLQRCEDANVSVSVGWAFGAKANESFSQIMHRADVRMYEAKRKYYKRNDRRLAMQ